MAALPKYELQTLFEIRERAKKQAEEDYAKKNQELQQEKNKLVEMQKTLEDMKQKRISKAHDYSEKRVKGDIKIEEIQSQDKLIDRLKDEEEEFLQKIANQQEVIETHKKIVEEALGVVSKKTQDFKAIEKHKEKWIKTKKYEAEKKDDDEADEISQARYFAVKKQKGNAK